MIPEMLQMAGKVALPRRHNDMRTFWLGAVAVRRDGAIVKSPNGPVNNLERYRTSKHYKKCIAAHAEARVLRKAGRGAVIFVARVQRESGRFTIAKPCDNCQTMLRSYGVKKVYYTVDNDSYDVMEFS